MGYMIYIIVEYDIIVRYDIVMLLIYINKA